MSRRQWVGFVVLPMLGIVGYYLALSLVPYSYRWLLVSEQGLVELGTAVAYGIATYMAVGLILKTKGSVPNLYRILYCIFALAALFVGLEEISYGQHLFGWESPTWFVEYNDRREINVHNLLGSKPARIWRDLALTGSLIGCIFLPILMRLRHPQYTPDHWAFYLLPRGELITLIALAALLRVLWRMPPSMLTGRHWGWAELMEFYWAVGALLYMVILWRRLIPSGSNVQRQFRPN
jgi:hypothetical protein